MPFLLIGTSFFSFAQFLGSIYTANKKTTMALVTNAIGVGVNLAVNTLLVVIFKVGIVGCAITTVCSYLVLWIVRIITTQKIVPIKYNITKTVLSVVLLIIQGIVMTVSLDTVITYIVCAVISAGLLVIFCKDFIVLIKFGLSLIKKFIPGRG